MTFSKNTGFLSPPPHFLTMAMAHLLAAVVFVIAVTLSLSSAEAQTVVRPPSLAVSAPGVLVIYTAKGGDSPGCTSDVEYRTPPGRGNADGTVNVTLGNTKQKGDHYRFTNAELTSGLSYDFRVRHTAGTNVDACQPHNTWSSWSHAYRFKPPHNIPNIGAVIVTAHTATGDGDKTGAATTSVPRGEWIGLKFKPMRGGSVFPHGIILQACSRKNAQDIDARDCSRDGNFFGHSERFDIKRGQSEAWRWFLVKESDWATNNRINLRFRTVSGNHKYWQWEAPIAKCWTRHGAYDPCKRIQLTVTAAMSGSDSDLNSETETIQPVTETIQPVTETTQPVTETTPEDDGGTENPDDGGDNNDYPVQGDSTTQGGNEGDGGNDDESESDNDEQDAGTSPDRAALMAIYAASGGEGWNMNDYWDSMEQIDEWHGVMTDEEGRVDELDLSGNNLSGTVAEEMADLEKLEKLDLSDNPDLTGELPPGLMDLTDLTELDISGTGVCPPADNEEFRTWLAGLGSAFSVNASCEEGGSEQTGEPTDGEAEESGGGGCAIASGEQKGSFQVFLAVFALATAVLCAGRFGVFRRG